jgi:polyribonucleotide nucleotidyltransferase
MDLNKKVFIKEIAGDELKLEVSNIAEQANAAVIATYGGTTALVAVVMGKSDTDLDYMPLTVDYEERFYASGKILGSRFVRREGRPSDEAILSGRLIDRTLRPLFDERIRRQIQVATTILSYDEENDPDFVALIAASTALAISDVPWDGPVAGVKVVKSGEKFLFNPKNSAYISDLNCRFQGFFAGNDKYINMIELSSSEADEDEIVEASERALEIIKDLVKFQKEIIEKIGKEKANIKLKEPDKKLIDEVESFIADKLEKAIYTKNRKDKLDRLAILSDELKEHLISSGFSENEIGNTNPIFDKKINDLLHKKILKEESRPDGRMLDEVRDLYSEVAFLPRAHGSALFMRGSTQSLATTTLASPGSEQLIETLEYSGKKRFMLHYNFPGFSVGEAKPFRGPGRREIGHGALAEKAIKPVIPPMDEFPYTIRVVSEILSSNGSSSMATVCAASLCLMDAGVPILRPVAGIAMGLITGENGEYKILTDIQGPEDHYGDMDLKVAGTRNGINAIQMDVKINGITPDIFKETLKKAKQARFHILDFTDTVLKQPREHISEFAPRIMSIQIDPLRIGEVIGPGGKVINNIIKTTGVLTIDINEDGKVYVASSDDESAEKAIKAIESIVKEFEIGEIVDGEVVKILEFGAIIDLGGGKSGLLHISELADSYTQDINKVLKIGDKVKAKIIKIENGKTSLSVKKVNNKE